MEPPSSSSSSALQLAMAALVGASLMAISAFFIHKRSVDQVLQRIIELRHDVSVNKRKQDEENEDGEEEPTDYYIERDDDGDYASNGELPTAPKTLSRFFDEKSLRSFRASSSLPNVALENSRWFDEDSKFDHRFNVRAQGFSSSLDNINCISSGLPPRPTDQTHGVYTILCFSFNAFCSYFCSSLF